jgi:aryl-alcohol dehydrogenase-like predicted oxidoreductase
MEYRFHNGEVISEIGLGGYSLSGVYGKKDPDPYINVVQRAYDLGVTFFDVADIYGPAEEILGRAIVPFRDQVWVATKVGWGSQGKPDCSPEHIKSSCEESLRRLRTGHIDLYQIHFDDPDTPVEQTVSALEELKTAGKIRHYGVSHMPLEKLGIYFNAGTVFSALMEFSAVARQAQGTKLALCQEKNVAAIAFSPTGRGILTGEIKPGHTFKKGDIRQIDPLFQREHFASALRVAERFRVLSERYDKTPVQVAIAWVLSQPWILCALTGPSTISHLEDNLGASGWNIPPEDLAELDVFFHHEDIRREAELKRAVRDILEQPLSPENAFKDLVYVLEVLVALELAHEGAVLQFFQQLLPYRSQQDQGVLDELCEIHSAMRARYLDLVVSSL